MVRPLAAAGYRVRAGGRRPEVLAARFEALAEPVRFDSLDPSTYPRALEGVDTVFYLVHSLATSRDYARLDREAASAFARSARAAGVRRIIFLGGLGEGSGALSEHLGSRQEVGRLIDKRSIRVQCSPAAAFAPIARLGGDRGWYSWDWLWHARGWFDQVTGGVGSRRGRRHPETLRPGDTLDFWRVVSVDPSRSLLLQAEMRVPGRAWLRYDVEPDGGAGGAVVTQTALFDSRGLLGLAYWYLLVPFHTLVFNGVLRGIERECRKERGEGHPPPVPP